MERVEEAIHKTFILALLECKEAEVTDSLCQLLSHSTKQNGLNLRTPAAVGAARLHQASSEASGVLMILLLEGTGLDSMAHKACVQEAGVLARKKRVEA